MNITIEELDKITSTKGYENLEFTVGEECAELIYKCVDTLKNMESSPHTVDTPKPDHLLKLAMSCDAKYEVQFTDYEENQYTIPIDLNKARIERIITDASIRKIRITLALKG